MIITQIKEIFILRKIKRIKAIKTRIRIRLKIKK